jgi:aminoglycoside 3-N-acetyltransferase
LTLLTQQEGILKCSICGETAIVRCPVCKSVFCKNHIRYGRLYGYKISKKSDYYCIGCWRIERNNILKHSVEKINIINGLKKLGIEKDDVLLVQSSISSFGSIDGSADSLVDLLKLSVGKNGTLIMPAFTPNAVRYHPTSTLVHRSCGVLPELLRRRRKNARNNNSKLSFIACGKFAVYIINNAIQYEKLDELSPIQRIINKKGKLLMLGSEFDNCLATIYSETVTTKTEGLSCGKKYPLLEDLYKTLKTYKETIIGQSLCRIFDLREAVDNVKNYLLKHPSYLYCLNDNCKECSKKRKISNVLLENNRYREK